MDLKKASFRKLASAVAFASQAFYPPLFENHVFPSFITSLAAVLGFPPACEFSVSLLCSAAGMVPLFLQRISLPHVLAKQMPPSRNAAASTPPTF
jgi:hypothetical protein